MGTVVTTTVDVGPGVTSTGDLVVTAAGLLEPFLGGIISNTVVTDGGRTFVVDGGIAIATTVVSGGPVAGGLQDVDGLVAGKTAIAIDTVVGAGGTEAVVSGGVTSAATILMGGGEGVFVSGSAVGMTVNGGSAVIFSGGTASGTDVINGGVLTVSSGGTDNGATVGPGGTLSVLSSGTDSGTSVTGGTMNVSSGGTADHTSVGTGGTMNVSSGGTASGTSVGSGGTLTVSSGGVVSALTIKDPNDPGVTAAANVLSGGTVDGATRIDGGILTLDAGAIFEPHAALDHHEHRLAAARTGLVQRHYQGLRRIGRIGPGQDQIHRPGARRDDRDVHANHWGRRPTSGRRGDPLSQPSLDRHLHDRELRTRERWSARHAGYFCPQCLAGRSRIAVHHQIDLRRSETMSKMDYRANGASRIRSLVADCFSEREAQGGRTEKCRFMGPFRRLPWCSDISAVGVQADIRASSKYSERPMCDI